MEAFSLEGNIAIFFKIKNMPFDNSRKLSYKFRHAQNMYKAVCCRIFYSRGWSLTTCGQIWPAVWLCK